jgi:hypothetical protein
MNLISAMSECPSEPTSISRTGIIPVRIGASDRVSALEYARGFVADQRRSTLWMSYCCLDADRVQ